MNKLEALSMAQLRDGWRQATEYAEHLERENVHLRQRVAELEADNERITALYRQAVVELRQAPDVDDEAVAVEVDTLRQQVAELEAQQAGVPALVERLLDEAFDQGMTYVCHAVGTSRQRFMRRLSEELALPASDGEGE